MPKILILDIGGTAVKASVMDEEKNVFEKEEHDTPHTSQQELLLLIKNIYKKYASYKLEGISISMPGIIDSERGYAYTGGFLTYNCESNFSALAEEYCGTKVFIENDGKCAALAEMWCGSLKDVENGMVLVLGTGLGGGIMLNRKLVKGKHFSAGELSYLCLNDQKFGEEEAMAGSCCGSLGLVEAAKEVLKAEALDGRDFFNMLNKGNELLEKVLEDYCSRIAVLVFNLQMILDVQRVAFGGGISRQPRLIECLQNQIDKVFSNKVYQDFSPKLRPEVVACSYFNESNQIGALYHYLNRTIHK